jgi:hypothetical protein
MNSKSLPYIIVDGSYATAFVDGKPMTAFSDHLNFDKIVEALYSGNHDTVVSLFDVVAHVGVERSAMSSSERKVVFDMSTGTLTYAGFPVHGVIVDRLIDLANRGVEAPVNKLLNFLENLYQNPSNRVIERLYTFLEKGNMPITDDGYFLAYKKVRENYKDVYSETFDNSIGAVVEMPRGLVNDNDDQTCSHGLHFCSYDYLQSFSGKRVMVQKINPKDVVSIPVDYNDTKGRCCKYEVIDEVTEQVESGPVWTKADAVVSVSKQNAPVDALLENEAWPFPVGDNVDPLNLGLLTNRHLATVWNVLVHMGEQIDHFRDKATGIRRLYKRFTHTQIRTALESL